MVGHKQERNVNSCEWADELTSSEFIMSEETPCSLCHIDCIDCRTSAEQLNFERHVQMARVDQLTPIPNTELTENEIQRLETEVGHPLPKDFRAFLANIGYASFIDIGYGTIQIGDKEAAFGQFYGKRPGLIFDPSNFETGALQIGERRSHYPPAAIIFSGDELGGEYFIRVGDESPGIYWMLYSENADYIYLCDTFTQFLDRIVIEPYDD